MKLIKWESFQNDNQPFTYTYWNSIEEEKKKAWWIEKISDIHKLTDYIKRSGLLEEFELFKSEASKLNLIKGKVLDVAAGVGWTTAFLSKIKNVEQVDALELSWHRINDIFPLIMKGLNGNEDKIRRIFGSFYNIREKNNYDLIFMSQAFHHADKPLKLLMECDSALKDNGAIVLIGEHLIKSFRYCKRFVSYLIRKKKLTTNFYELFKPDNILGDHYYRISDYQFMFNSIGYEFKYYRSNIRDSIIIIGIKK